MRIYFKNNHAIFETTATTTSATASRTLFRRNLHHMGTLSTFKSTLNTCRFSLSFPDFWLPAYECYFMQDLVCCLIDIHVPKVGHQIWSYYKKRSGLLTFIAAGFPLPFSEIKIPNTWNVEIIIIWSWSDGLQCMHLSDELEYTVGLLQILNSEYIGLAFDRFDSVGWFFFGPVRPVWQKSIS